MERDGWPIGSARDRRDRVGAYRSTNVRMPLIIVCRRVLAAIGSTSLPWTVVGRPAFRRMACRFCSMKSGWPSSITRTARLFSQNR